MAYFQQWESYQYKEKILNTTLKNSKLAKKIPVPKALLSVETFISAMGKAVIKTNEYAIAKINVASKFSRIFSEIKMKVNIINETNDAMTNN